MVAPITLQQWISATYHIEAALRKSDIVEAVDRLRAMREELAIKYKVQCK